MNEGGNKDLAKLARERALEAALDERVGDRAAPDLTARILHAAKERERADSRTTASARTFAMRPVELPEGAEAAGKLAGSPTGASVLRMRLGIGLAAASVAIGVGLIWFGTPAEGPANNQTANNHRHPVAPGKPVYVLAPDANYDRESGALSLHQGWAMVNGEPLLMQAGGNRIASRDARAVVLAGGVPDEASIRRIGEQLQYRQINLSEEERNMLNNPIKWRVRGGMAMCLLAGSMLINGEAVSAQEAEGERTSETSENKTRVMSGSAMKVEVREGGDTEGKADAAGAEEALRMAREVMGSLRKAQPFESLDTDKDGFLSKEEHADQAGDKDGDGRLSKEEFDASRPRVMSRVVVGEKRKPFADVDKNGNGELDATELSADEVRRLDKDENGVVSEEEYRTGSAGVAYKVEEVKEAMGKVEEEARRVEGEARRIEEEMERALAEARSAMFKALDTNGDGSFNDQDTGWNDTYKAADTNGDGTVTEEELGAWSKPSVNGIRRVVTRRVVTRPVEDGAQPAPGPNGQPAQPNRRAYRVVPEGEPEGESEDGAGS